MFISTPYYCPDLLNSAVTSYDAANRITSLSGDSLTYDDNGNLTGWGSASLTWDARDQLMAVNATVDASFAYDGLGRRIEKTVDETTTTYLYDGLDMVEMDDGTTSYYFVHGPGIDEPLAMVGSDGLVRYYHADMLGSVVALTNSSGSVMTQYNYSPFGETEAIGETSPNPFMFTGRELDETGLYFYRARYYSPVMKRFISEDPIGYAAGDVNFYRYVGNSPGNWVDPLGLIINMVNKSGKALSINPDIVLALAVDQIRSNPNLRDRLNKALNGKAEIEDILSGEINVEAGIYNVNLPVCMAKGQTRWDGIFIQRFPGQTDKSIGLHQGLFNPRGWTSKRDYREAAEALIHELGHWATAYGHNTATGGIPENYYYDPGDYFQDAIRW